MGARILRIELRRSVALWAALVIAAAGVFVLFASNEPYGSWMQLVISSRDIMQLTWPLALAAGAWQALRERRSRVEELMATTPRPRWQRVLPVATAMAIAAVAAYLVMLAGAASHLRHIDGYFSLGAIPLIALGALAMVGAVWLGQAIGTLLPSPLTAPMLAVVGFLGLAVSPMIVAQDSRDPGTFLLFPYLQGPRDGGFAIQMLSSPGEPVPGAVVRGIGRDRACRLRGLPAEDSAGRPAAGPARRRDRRTGNAAHAVRRLDRGPARHRARVHRRRAEVCISRLHALRVGRRARAGQRRRCPSSRRSCPAAPDPGSGADRRRQRSRRSADRGHPGGEHPVRSET